MVPRTESPPPPPPPPPPSRPVRPTTRLQAVHNRESTSTSTASQGSHSTPPVHPQEPPLTVQPGGSHSFGLRLDPNKRRPTADRAQTKASFVSPTPSSEADDEDSILGRDRMDSDDDDHEEGRCGPPQYYGDDTRFTSKKELMGWYSYGWAAEVFAICAMGSFLPITLEQLARDQGVLLSDKSISCSASWQTEHGSVDAADHRKHPRASSQCVVHILGVEINTASFAMYTFSISVFIQAILIISMSGAADHGKYRKTYLLAFAFIGAIATMLFLPVVPKLYLLGALLAIIGNTCFGASFVLLNSFLPLLVRHHPSVQEHGERAGSSNESYHSTDSYDDEEEHRHLISDNHTPLLPNDVLGHTATPHPSSDVISPELKLSTQISSYGIGIGYIAGVLVQTIAIGIVVMTGSTTFSLRLVLFFIGLWWLGFSIPPAMWLRPRPGPPLPFIDGKRRKSWIGYLSYSWRSLWKTIKQARHLKDVLLFLGAWFLLSDGIATVSGTAVLFAKTQLGMQPAALGLINVIATISGVIGAFSWSSISRYFNLRASQTIIACICVFELIPIYGLLGYIPAIRNFGVFGLQQQWEMYPVGAVYGFILGGLSSYCRSFFGELIPPGAEAAFYALYAITDKGSSIFGPAIVGAITDRYGEIRPAFVFLAILISLPLPLMLMVDVDRGKADAARLAQEIGGHAQRRRDYRDVQRIQLIDEDPEDTSNSP